PQGACPVPRRGAKQYGKRPVPRVPTMWPFRAWQRKRLLARYAIEPTLWREVLQSLPILDGLDREETELLRQRCILFLHGKRLTTLPGVELQLADRLRLAAQAQLP